MLSQQQQRNQLEEEARAGTTAEAEEAEELRMKQAEEEARARARAKAEEAQELRRKIAKQEARAKVAEARARARAKAKEAEELRLKVAKLRTMVTSAQMVRTEMQSLLGKVIDDLQLKKFLPATFGKDSDLVVGSWTLPPHCSVAETRRLLDMLTRYQATLEEELSFLSKVKQDPTSLQAAFASIGFSSTALQHSPRLMLLLGKVLSQHFAPDVMKDLGDFQKVFSTHHSRHYSLKDADYGTCGGHKYYKPVGWNRFALNVPDYDKKYKDWCVACHGTNNKHALPILLSGLKPPGSNGIQVEHGQAGANGQPTIYCSPSIEYAAHPVYSQLFKLAEDHWGQVVMQCRVRPGSFKEQGNTLGQSHWPRKVCFDKNFPNNDCMEWLLTDSSDIVVVGLMIREFGSLASADDYGDLATQVRADGDTRGPEYHWMSFAQQST